ncbi:MAG: CsgG/HfaB family protein [Chitinispirillaceae bacterium]|jgi:curli biogenesis system outer membrane secretion channel CsgG
MKMLLPNKSTVPFLTLLFLLSAETVPAVQIKLSNGTVLVGDIVSQNDSSIVVQIGESKVSIVKNMVIEIAGLAVGTTFAPAATPAPQHPPQAEPTFVPVAQPAFTPPMAGPTPLPLDQSPAPLTVQPLFGQARQGGDSMKVTYISVLPIESKDISPSLLSVLADEFRRSCNETGVFKVMERGIMEKILSEQAFQMTGAVDEADMVKVGKIIGVSRIVSASVVKVADGSYAVSAKMVDVESGSILGTASEKRSGDSFEVIKRMLNNLAFVLAGTTTPDHEEYLKMAAKETEEQQKAEKMGQSRFYFSAGGLAAYPVYLFQTNGETTKREYFEKAPALTSWGVPSDIFDFGGICNFGIRLSPSLWLAGKCGYYRTGLRKGYTIANYYNDTSLYVGSRPDTARIEGPDDILSRSERSFEVTNLGIGLKWQFYRNPRIAIGVTVVPEIGFITCTENSYDSSFANNNLYTNGVFMGKEQIYSQEIRQTTLKGTAFGCDLDGTAEVYLFKNLGLNLTCGLSYLLSGTLTGKTRVQRYEIDRSPVQNTVTDTSYTENAALVKGNFLGTGEFFQIENPDVKQKDPDGNPVTITKALKEFATFRISLGVVYYF